MANKIHIIKLMIVNNKQWSAMNFVSFILVMLTINYIHRTNQLMLYPSNSSPAPRMRVPLKVPVIKGRVPYRTFTSTKGTKIYSSTSSESTASSDDTTIDDMKASTMPMIPSTTPSPSPSPYQTYTDRSTDRMTSSSQPSLQSSSSPMLLNDNNNNNLNIHHQSNLHQEKARQSESGSSQSNIDNNGNHNSIISATAAVVSSAPPPPPPSPPPPPPSSSASSMNNNDNNNKKIIITGLNHQQSASSLPPPTTTTTAAKIIKKKINHFPLNELVNVIAQAAINGEIPFNKVDFNKPFRMQQLQIPILLLRPEDIYKASSSNNINFKLITAQPIRIPIYEEPANNNNNMNNNNNINHNNNNDINNNNLNNNLINNSNNNENNRYLMSSNVNKNMIFNQRRPASIHNRHRSRDFNSNHHMNHHQHHHQQQQPHHQQQQQQSFNPNQIMNGRPPYNRPQPQQQQQPQPQPAPFMPYAKPAMHQPRVPAPPPPPQQQQPFRYQSNNHNNLNNLPPTTPLLLPNLVDPNHSINFGINHNNGINDNSIKNHDFGSDNFNNNPKINEFNDPYVLFNPNNGKQHPNLDFRKPMNVNNQPHPQPQPHSQPQPQPQPINHGPFNNRIPKNFNDENIINNNLNNNIQDNVNFKYDNGINHNNQNNNNNNFNDYNNFNNNNNNQTPTLLPPPPPPPKLDAIKILPAPNLVKLSNNEERWPMMFDNSMENNHSNYNNNNHQSMIADHMNNQPINDQQNTLTNQSPPVISGKKRTRPVIRIKAERPPIRINSVGQIKLKAERQTRLKPKIRYVDRTKDLPPINDQDSNEDSVSSNESDRQNNDDDVGYEKQPEQSFLNPRIHHQHRHISRGHKKVLHVHSNKPTRSKVIPEKYLKTLPPIRNGDHSRPISPMTDAHNDYYYNRHNDNDGDHKLMAMKNHGHHRGSKLNVYDDINNKNVRPIYRSKSPLNDNDSRELEDSEERPSSIKPHKTSSKSSSTTTVRTSEGLEELEKSTYDKQLLKTLKNLVVTGGKRHKLDFEDKQGEIRKVQTKGKIPEKYLRQFPSEAKYKSLSNNDDNDSNNSYDTNNPNDYDTRTIDSSSNEDLKDNLNDDLGSDEMNDEYERSSSSSSSSASHQRSRSESSRLSSRQKTPPTTTIKRYRVKGFDPNYQYIGLPDLNSNSNNNNDNSAEYDDDGNNSNNNNNNGNYNVLNQMKNPPTASAAITEQIGNDGRKIKTYILSGVYRKKVDEIVRNEADESLDDDLNNNSYLSNDESRQILQFIRPEAAAATADAATTAAATSSVSNENDNQIQNLMKGLDIDNIVTASATKSEQSSMDNIVAPTTALPILLSGDDNSNNHSKSLI